MAVREIIKRTKTTPTRNIVGPIFCFKLRLEKKTNKQKILQFHGVLKITLPRKQNLFDKPTARPEVLGIGVGKGKYINTSSSTGIPMALCSSLSFFPLFFSE
uniref:Uncharacterized protein n=1 Tax=Cacopsylla melanoneura TaxID=428564 RepID=A0A8D8SSJ7_9HEMI